MWDSSDYNQIICKKYHYFIEQWDTWFKSQYVSISNLYKQFYIDLWLITIKFFENSNTNITSMSNTLVTFTLDEVFTIPNKKVSITCFKR